MRKAKPDRLASERERQRVAYETLKAAGQKVKANFEDYLTGRGRNRSLINRANRLLRGTGKGSGEETVFKSAVDGEGFRYRRYTRDFGQGVSPRAALREGMGLVTLFVDRGERVRMLFYGMSKRYGEDSIQWQGTAYGTPDTIGELAASVAAQFESVFAVAINLRTKTKL